MRISTISMMLLQGDGCCLRERRLGSADVMSLPSSSRPNLFSGD